MPRARAPTRPLPPTPPDTDDEPTLSPSSSPIASKIAGVVSELAKRHESISNRHAGKDGSQNAEEDNVPPPPPPPPLPTPPLPNFGIQRSQTMPMHFRSASASAISNRSPPTTPTKNLASSPTPSVLKRNNSVTGTNGKATPDTPPSSPPAASSSSNSTPPSSAKRTKSPPPPTKPKPAGLKRNNTVTGLGSSTTSSGASTPLLKAALVSATNLKATLGSGKEDRDKEDEEKEPERRESVSSLAKSLGPSIHLGMPNANGLPYKRASRETAQTPNEIVDSAVTDPSPPASASASSSTTEFKTALSTPPASPTPPPVPAPMAHPDALKAAIKAAAGRRAMKSGESIDTDFEETKEEVVKEEVTPSKVQEPIDSVITVESNVELPPVPPKDGRERLMSTNSAMTVKPAPKSVNPIEASDSEKPADEPPARRFSIQPPPRPPPPPPEVTSPIAETDEDEDEAKILPPLVTDVENGRILDGEVTGEPEEMDDEKTVDVNVTDANDEDDEGAESDSSSSSDGKQTSFRSALSRTLGSNSDDSSIRLSKKIIPDFLLTSKWSRNTSAVNSTHVSVTTQSQPRRSEDTGYSAEQSEETAVSEESSNAIVIPENIGNIPSPPLPTPPAFSVQQQQTLPPAPTVGRAFPELLDDPRFPPISAFPAPKPLPFKPGRSKTTSELPERRNGLAGLGSLGDPSLTSLAEDKIAEERENALARLNSNSKSALTSAIEAALAKSPPDPNSPALSQSNTAHGTPSRQGSAGSDEDDDEYDEHTDTVGNLVNAKLASLDKLELPRPSAFPSAPSPNPKELKRSGSEEERMRQFRLSSKLSPVTGAVRMETAPSAGRSNPNLKNMVSSETVGTIGTIATELGELDDFTAFLSRSGGTAADRRPPIRRQTTSQSSRFVEDLPISLPFFKKSATMAASRSGDSGGSGGSNEGTDVRSGLQRSNTFSFGVRSDGSTGPPTRKMSLVPELRAATIALAERPMSTMDDDFVLIEEPEEFDIPRAEWDLPRIPSGSLNMSSTVSLNKNGRIPEEDEGSSGEDDGEEAGPMSAPPFGSAPAIVKSSSAFSAPPEMHSRSASQRTAASEVTNHTNASSAPATPVSSPKRQATTDTNNMLMSPIGDGTQAPRLSSDALLDLWGRIGVYISDAAALLHDKSRRVLVGDGTYPGFVLAVARQVPLACIPSQTARYPYGHLIYFQTAATVHKRYAEIMPGDVIVLQNALFKGAKGKLGGVYTEEVGARGEPVVGIIGEFEARKSKAKVYQANQHVGVQTVEYVSYRFDDLKSGTVKIFRIPDS